MTTRPTPAETDPTSTGTSPPKSFNSQRVAGGALITSGALLAVGGSMHPSAPSDLGLRQEFAIMMSDDAWVPGHALIVLSTVLLAIGLALLYRVTPSTRPDRSALRFAHLAVAAYVGETVLHLFSYVDADRLRNGDFAPIAFAHIGLAAVLYPLSGLAVTLLAARWWRTWSVPARTFAAAGIVAGVLHGLSVPLTLTFGDVDTTPFFAFGAIGIAIWSMAAGVVELRAADSTTRSDAQRPVPATW